MLFSDGRKEFSDKLHNVCGVITKWDTVWMALIWVQQTFVHPVVKPKFLSKNENDNLARFQCVSSGSWTNLNIKLFGVLSQEWWDRAFLSSPRYLSKIPNKTMCVSMTINLHWTCIIIYVSLLLSPCQIFYMCAMTPLWFGKHWNGVCNAVLT